MIDPVARPGTTPVRRVAVVTGSRAEFGLLRPVMRAIAEHPALALQVIAAGSHLLPPAMTIEEVSAEFPVAARVPMQEVAQTSRLADALAVGRGVSAFAEAFGTLAPEWVVVLGDRIEAFAAAAAASVGGIAVAHIHGGDRAEGVADEAMRHAVTKLAHLHLAATRASAERLGRMGEPEWRIHVVGSPAMDGLGEVPPLGDAAFEDLGAPEAVFLMHPIGRTEREEHAAAAAALRALGRSGLRVLALHPNHDPGREGVLRAIAEAARQVRGADEQGKGGVVHVEAHLARGVFLGLLRRVRVLVGNSSGALIEAAAVGGVGCAAVDIGARQAGRERAGNVVHADEEERSIATALERALSLRGPFEHPYGDGRTGERIAAVLAEAEGRSARVLRKQNAY